MYTPPAYNLDTPNFHAQRSVHNDHEKALTTKPLIAPESTSAKEDPTPKDDDLQHLRQVAGKVPFPAYMLAFLETVSSVAISGAGIIATNFIQHPLPPGSVTGAGHEGQSGALGLGQRVSTGLGLGRSIFSSLTPLLGAFVADQYLGRYPTLQYSNALTCLGHAFITLSAIPSNISHRRTALVLYAFGTIFKGIGIGGWGPNISALLGEQIPDNEINVATTKSGNRIIVKPEATRQRLFLYLGWCVNVGSVIGMAGMAYVEKYVGFWLAFLIPTIMLGFCPFILAAPRKLYKRAKPEHSVLPKTCRLCWLVMKGRWSWSPFQLYHNIQDPHLWTRVKPSNIVDKPKWMTFDDSWVDEVRHALRGSLVLLWFPLWYPAIRQMSTNLMSQAATTKLGGIPNDLLINLNPLAYIILAPLYAHFIYPTIDRFGLRFGPIRRISTGFFLSTIAMGIAAVVQYYIYATNPCRTQANTCIARDQRSPISVWVQLPIYFLFANSEILALTTSMEYLYSHAPRNLKSFSMALIGLTGAVGAAFGQMLVPLSEDPYLVWNYVALGVLSLIASVGSYWCHHGRDEEAREKVKEEELEQVAGSGTRGELKKDAGETRC